MLLLLLLAALTTGDHVLSVRVGSATRSYLVHVPASARPPAPVVLAFHGGLGNGRTMQRFSGLDATAEQAGFIVVYPDGSGRVPGLLTWNGGSCCGYAQRSGVDDVGFTRALLDDLATRLAIDPARVYATGMSNGAIMAYRLAAELPDRIAAIAPVAGSLEVALPASGRPVPIVHFHGTRDEHVPIGGGRGRQTAPGLRFHSLAETLAPWLRRNGCGTTPSVTLLPDPAADGTRVRREAYPGCQADVVVYVVEGGGHSWPGSSSRAQFLGATTHDISANDVLWQFFAEHPR